MLGEQSRSPAAPARRGVAGGCSAPEVPAILCLFRFQSSSLFPASNKTPSPVRARQIAEFVKFRIAIIAEVGERLRRGELRRGGGGGARGVRAHGRGRSARSRPGGQRRNGPAPLPLRPQPRSPRAEPSGGLNCDRLKHARSLQCTFMTRAFPFVHAVELKSGAIPV